MRNFTLLFALFAFTKFFAQTPCATGRFAEDVYTAINTTSDIVYGSNASYSGSTTSLTLDFYEPQGDTMAARPLIIWVHGGSFIGGSKTDIDVKTWAQKFAKKGYACASINYRLGFFPFDSANAVKAVVRAVQDLRASVRFFYKDRATTNTYKIDTTRIFVGGSSAGAITSLHLAYLDKECEISDYLNASTIASLGGLEGTSGNPGYSSKVIGVINGCGALARYSWLEAGDVPLCSIHGTADGTVKYNRGVVNPGVALMYLDGSRMLYDRACAVNLDHQFYTFPGAPHVPYAGTDATSLAYMDTTVNFIRDFLVRQMGCTNSVIQPANQPMEVAHLYPINYCNGDPVNEICPTSGIEENKIADFNVFPNPTSSNVTITFANEESFNMTMVDLMGRVVRSQSNVVSGSNFTVAGLQNGNYFLVLTDANGQVRGTKQVVVQ